MAGARLPLPEGDLAFCALASIPALGNALTISSEGDAVLRVEVAPESVAELTALLRQLQQRTFFVAIVRPAVKEKAHALAKNARPRPLPEPQPQAEEAAPAARPRARRRRRDAAAQPDRRTH